MIFQKTHRCQKADQSRVTRMSGHFAKVNTAASIHKWVCFYYSSSHLCSLSIFLTCMIAKGQIVSWLILRR